MDPLIAIVLAAGKGKRMGTPDLPKVCHEVDGEPAIRRALRTYHGCGIDTHLVVVGAGAQQVIEAVAGAPGQHLFCYQPEPLGTGNAARVAVDALRAAGFRGDVLLVAGDKVVDPAILRRLLATRGHGESRCDLAFVVGPASAFPTSGRVVVDSAGRPKEIVEAADLPAKPYARESEWVNLSVYLFRSEALFSALESLSTDNAQGEEYLTDTIRIIARAGGTTRVVPVNDYRQVMGFNTPAELEEIRRYQAARVAAERGPHAAREWLNALESRQTPNPLAAIYGAGTVRAAEQRKRLSAMLVQYLERHGDGRVVLSRAPGRVNIMGRHIDHQGGHVNAIAIDRDVWVVAGASADGRVRLSNLDCTRFADREFDPASLLDGFYGQPWREFVDSAPPRDRASRLTGDWSLYVMAALARANALFPERFHQGVSAVVSGDIPPAAGLSSSSALVVATMEALASLNGFELSADEFVERCGEAEWFVGTRGGAGDHAAMKFGRAGRVAQMGFHPFHVEESVAFPPGCVMLVCDSGIQARKTDGARDTFNHRVACYHLGRELLKRWFPEHADAIRHLRDLSPQNLGIGTPELLRMIRRLPHQATRSEVRALLGDAAEPYLATHAESVGDYPLRDVMLFGVAECERARRCPSLLGEGKIEEFGRWVSRSHDGDRVVRWCAGASTPAIEDCSDEAMDRRTALAESGAYELALEPGAYMCSRPEVDRMVDLALSVDGVLGAQIAGAGLGGCMMVLVRKEAAESVERALVEGYYEPTGIRPTILRSFPVPGSGVLRGNQ